VHQQSDHLPRESRENPSHPAQRSAALLPGRHPQQDPSNDRSAVQRHESKGATSQPARVAQANPPALLQP